MPTPRVQTQSEKLFDESLTLFPGGVNSPVRAFGAVGGTPRFIAKAQGSKLWDVDGNEYIDYVGSWGPAILGHADPKVMAAVQKAAENGFSFGAPTELESRLALLVKGAFPSIEKMRFVSSGTEATMSALRAARGFTKRQHILKFDGCYHGHADTLLVKAGSGAATFGTASSAGVIPEFAKYTLNVAYNDLHAVEGALQKHKNDVAAIIVEPVVGNSGVILPQPEFLPGLRKLCDAHGTLLIFDEVMTGFRVAFGGAQFLYKIKSDLTCLGKVIGGGLPVGAYGGRQEIMDQISPLGPVYQAGTLSGNPLAMTAGIETLKQLAVPGVYDRLQKLTDQLASGIAEIAKAKKVGLKVPSVCGMLSIFFDRDPVQTFKKFFHDCLAHGVYLPPSVYESWFVSLAHTEKDLQQTLHVIEAALG